MRDPAEFWDKRADAYSKKPVKDMENYDKTLASCAHGSAWFGNAEGR